DVQEVGALQVRVAVVLTGVDRGGVDGRGDRRCGRILSHGDLTGHAAEATPDLAHHQAPGDEPGPRVCRIDGEHPGGGEGETVPATGTRGGRCTHYRCPPRQSDVNSYISLKDYLDFKIPPVKGC